MSARSHVGVTDARGNTSASETPHICKMLRIFHHHLLQKLQNLLCNLLQNLLQLLRNLLRNLLWNLLPNLLRDLLRSAPKSLLWLKTPKLRC